MLKVWESLSKQVKEGLDVGNSVGLDDGKVEGIIEMVGSPEGIEEGWWLVGLTEGNNVGAWLGDIEGELVGFLDGDIDTVGEFVKTGGQKPHDLEQDLAILPSKSLQYISLLKSICR